MQLHQEEKTPAQVFSYKLSEIFKNMPERMLERNEPKNIVFTKDIHRKTPVMASFLGQLQTGVLTVFPKGTPSRMIFYENCEVLQNIIFSELRCAAASDFL